MALWRWVYITGNSKISFFIQKTAKKLLFGLIQNGEKGINLTLSSAFNSLMFTVFCILA
tara:strand:- start:687 stop:863 length:177 start_codon:yes stop_codon:yes gene_type:complete